MDKKATATIIIIVGIFLIATVGVCIKEYSKKKTLFVSEDDAITMVQESEMYGSMVAQYGPENVNITSHKLYTYDEYKEISHSFPYNYPPSGLKEGSSVWIIEVHITNREGLTAIIDSDTGKGNLIDREEGKTELLAK